MSREFTKENVLAHLKLNDKKRYQVANLAKTFGTKAQNMRELLDSISEVKTGMEGMHKVYFYLSDEEANKPVPEPLKLPGGEWKMPAGMRDRCRELYLEGTFFKGVG